MGAKDDHDHCLPLIRAALVAVVVASALAFAGPAGTSLAAIEKLPLERRLAEALASSGLDPARTSALAADLSTGEVVFTRNARRSLAPASTEKLAVTFAALRLLGPAYRFRTELVGDGRLLGHTWKGSIALIGLGDPTLERADLSGLAHQIAGLGIRRITGDVIADARFYDARRTAPGWRPSFLGIESAPLSALTVERDGLARGGPEVTAASRLITSLELAGVAVRGRARLGTAPANGLPLAEDLSDPLAAVLRAMNRESDNFLAEMTLKQLGAVILGRGTTPAGAAVVRLELLRSGIPLDGVRILDGSGLSLGDRTTSACLVALLHAAYADLAIRDAFVGSLAIAGVAGTLEDRLARRPTFAHVVAKTGTTNRASALAGYVRGRYVFSVLHNGSPVAAEAARAAQDRFVTVLASS